METLLLKPREYQRQILDDVEIGISNSKNVIIELDCGLGKRFLQYSLIKNSFSSSKIILILQASTSLYETYNYMLKYLDKKEIGIIDSRKPSHFRIQILNTCRVVLTLPQTLANTLKRDRTIIENYDYIIINEVDQIIRRMGHGSSLKHPYTKLLQIFTDKQIIGMSGTLRDDHYILDKDQLKIQKELVTLENHIDNIDLISMKSILKTDLNDFIELSEILPTSVQDNRLAKISNHLDNQIENVKNEIFTQIKSNDYAFYLKLKKDRTLLFGPLPINEELHRKFSSGYLVRKYLWAMDGENARKHLLGYGLSIDLVRTLPIVPSKFLKLKELIFENQKSVILCSFVSSVDRIQQLCDKWQVKSIKITGKTKGTNRAEELDKFRASSERSVAILSNVGERDLDLPEADQLIIFDLVRTTKTVYQKLKRSRGGLCRILYYSDTRETQKVKSVVDSIAKKYHWSIKINNNEKE